LNYFGNLSEYVGQTKTKVTEKLGQAKGAVLFIDEAYELGKGEFGYISRVSETQLN
jgi:hypothetical protein